MPSRDQTSPQAHRLCTALRSYLNARPLTDRALVEGARVLLEIKECRVFCTRKIRTIGQFCAQEPSIQSERDGRRLLRIGRWLTPQEVALTSLHLQGLEALTLVRERHPKATLASVFCDGELRYSPRLRAVCKTAREAVFSAQ